ncbi:MAG TPA: ABC transporter permease [Casimicrobiaceae bacterium]|jgi:peptide/nickel transport system permease protein|nr:ABC transporter permease [Casimicrobiaceae bacterium]
MSPLAVAMGRGAWARLGAGIRHHKMASFGAGIVVLMVLSALLAPWLAPHDPLEQDVLLRLASPSADFPLGNDSFGRDILARILWGGRVSLYVSTLSVLIAIFVGGALGILAGYIGGLFDRVLMAAMDVLLSFPTLVMGLLVVAMLGPTVGNLILAITLTAVAPFARIARAPTLTVKERDFVEAGRALGFSHLRIMVVHILPNVMDDILVMAALWLATAIRTEASLSFIGLGVRPPTASWGGMIREGFENILDAPWLAIFPSIAILVVMFGLNMLGDGLRDTSDPRLRHE